MDPISLGLGVGAPIIGGILGNVLGGDDRDAARAAQLAALHGFQHVHVPTIEEQRIELEKEVSAGTLTPQMEKDILAAQSQMAGVSTDPRLRDAQMNALSQLQQQGKAGLTAEDNAALQNIQRGVAQQEQGRSQALLQNMAARGMGGSGSELAAQLAASQGAASRSQEQGNQVAAMAQQRALQAMASAGQLGGSIRGQDFGQQSDIARAQDVINQFNTSNRIGTQARNVGSSNSAQAANLNNAQNISNTNTALANQQEMHNKGLYQQQFQNAMGLAQGTAGAYGNQAAGLQHNADTTAGMWSGIGQGIGEGATAYGIAKAKIKAGAADTANDQNSGGAYSRRAPAPMAQ